MLHSGQEDAGVVVAGCSRRIPVLADLFSGLSKIAAFEYVMDGIIEAFDLSQGQFTIENRFW